MFAVLFDQRPSIRSGWYYQDSILPKTTLSSVVCMLQVALVRFVVFNTLTCVWRQIWGANRKKLIKKKGELCWGYLERQNHSKKLVNLLEDLSELWKISCRSFKKQKQCNMHIEVTAIRSYLGKTEVKFWEKQEEQRKLHYKIFICEELYFGHSIISGNICINKENIFGTVTFFSDQTSSPPSLTTRLHTSGRWRITSTAEVTRIVSWPWVSDRLVS